MNTVMFGPLPVSDISPVMLREHVSISSSLTAVPMMPTVALVKLGTSFDVGFREDSQRAPPLQSDLPQAVHEGNLRPRYFRR
jgi:hypothetical protein